MPSKDREKTTRAERRSSGGPGDDELEPIIDPVKIDEAEEPVARAPFVADAVDDLLTDVLGHNGDGEDDVDDGHIRLDLDEPVAAPPAVGRRGVAGVRERSRRGTAR